MGSDEENGDSVKISTLYARFYKSLNFDYVAKSNGNELSPWDSVADGRPFPYVRIPLEPDITTIVGSNESGKTQVIDAIRFAITGREISRRDFCRYSEFFAVDAPVSYPEFGIGLDGSRPDEVERANELLGLEGEAALSTLDGARLFRCEADNDARAEVHLPGEPAIQVGLGADTLDGWAELLPDVWEIDADVALPDSVPIGWLIDQRPEHALSREERIDAVNSFLEIQHLFASPESITQHAAAIAEAVSKPRRANAETRTQLSVAADLLFTVARVDRSNIDELRRAIADGEEGYVATIVDSINEQIDQHLAPDRWWTQDRDFKVLVSPRDHDLVLTIRDRTGKDYTFDERSKGLKYFLSYLVQFLAGRPRVGAQPRLLLMDEPDAFLSGKGQQDLLRILATAAEPEDPEFQPCQVVYVTHSPFLIDRNQPARVRVLEKGDLDEGTRVVAAAHHNRFEPIRTALGQQVAESTFVGAQNIIVEGASDQILIAGMNTELRNHGVGGAPIPRADVLDLNDVVLVQAGGTPHIPYMTYLARGRGEIKPSVVVLLDSDPAGEAAIAELRELAGGGQPIVREEFVLGLADASQMTLAATIEDLVPWEAALAAVRHFLHGLGKDVPMPPAAPDSDTSSFTQINEILAEVGSPIRCGKVAFARAVVESMPTLDEAHRLALVESFAPLIKSLATVSTKSQAVERQGEIRRRLSRSIRRFRRERNSASQRHWASVLLDELESLIDAGPSYEPLRQRVRDLRHKYDLSNDLGEPFLEHDDFGGELDPLLNMLRIDAVGH